MYSEKYKPTIQQLDGMKKKLKAELEKLI